RGPFSTKEMLDFWDDSVGGSLHEEGFPFARSAGETTWTLKELPGLYDFLTYEAELNRFLPRYPQVTMCLSALDRFGGQALVDTMPTLTRQGRVEAVWLDEEWRAVDCVRGRGGPRTDLEARIAELGGGGGALQWPGVGWAWAFPLTSRGGASGYLVVGSPERPAEHEWSLIQGLAQQTGMALANARLLARERAMRSRIVAEQAT